MLSVVCKAWPTRWNEYVVIACWITRTVPDTSLPSAMTPFQLLFGGSSRTSLDILVPQMDDAEATEASRTSPKDADTICERSVRRSRGCERAGKKRVSTRTPRSSGRQPAPASRGATSSSRGRATARSTETGWGRSRFTRNGRVRGGWWTWCFRA